MNVAQSTHKKRKRERENKQVLIQWHHPRSVAIQWTSVKVTSIAGEHEQPENNTKMS